MGRFPFRILIVMAALAGCAAHPRQTAMVAATPQSGFGYSETKFSPTRYEVRYATPTLKLPPDAENRASAVEKKKQRASDLALWHAAEIALAGGFTQLSIGPAHRDAEVQVKKLYTPAAPGVFGPGGMIYPQWIYNPVACQRLQCFSI